MSGNPRTPPRTTSKPVGRAAVEERLVEIAGDMLAEVGPKAFSMRELSTRAQVNVAQAYHYFGSKEKLLIEAMRKLASAWYEEASPSVGVVAHPTLSLGNYERYWRALVHAILDDDLELADVPSRMNISVARLAIDNIISKLDRKLTPNERVNIAAAYGLSLGWVVFERFMLKLVGLPDDPKTLELARQHIGTLSRGLIEQLERPAATPKRKARTRRAPV